MRPAMLVLGGGLVIKFLCNKSSIYARCLYLWLCIVNYIMLFVMNAGAVGSASATTLSKGCMLAAMVWYLKVHFHSARQKYDLLILSL